MSSKLFSGSLISLKTNNRRSPPTLRGSQNLFVCAWAPAPSPASAFSLGRSLSVKPGARGRPRKFSRIHLSSPPAEPEARGLSGPPSHQHAGARVPDFPLSSLGKIRTSVTGESHGERGRGGEGRAWGRSFPFRRGRWS